MIAPYLLIVGLASAAVHRLIYLDGGVHGPHVVRLVAGLMWMPGLAALALMRKEGVSWKSIGWDTGPLSDLAIAGVVPLAVHLSLLAVLAGLGLAAFPPEWKGVDHPALLSSAFQIFIVRKWLMIPSILPCTLGEEIGWRGWLQRRLTRKFGWAGGVAALGALWGYWHFPLIWMGFNFPAYPRLGAFVTMPLLCFGWGAFASWIYRRSGSIWAPSIAHASINATCWMELEFLRGNPLTISYSLAAVWFAIGLLCLFKPGEAAGGARARR